MVINENLRIYCPADRCLYYFTKIVHQTVKHLQSFLGTAHQIHLYPEATMKTNKMPNGLAISCESKHSILIPQLLRDPGCGFLMFKIKQQSHCQPSELYQAMDQYLTSKEKSILYPVTKKEVKRSLKEGVFNLAQQDTWDSLIDFDFKPDLSVVQFEEDNYLDLLSDMNVLTNSVELKYLEGDPNSIIGMIHTGSEVFPKLILKHWAKILREYTIKNIHEDPEMIEKGYWGVHSRSEEGYAYLQWLKAAMNFCIYKRYHIFTELREHLQHSLGIDLELINDRCHAGLFEKKISGKHYQLQSRGVQPLETKKSKVFLIAGHRETISLVLNLDDEHPNLPPYIGHGTGYVNEPGVNYSQLISGELFEKCKHAYETLHANTSKKFTELAPFTANVLNQYEGILSPSQYQLAFPLYNYMGRPLRGLYA